MTDGLSTLYQDLLTGSYDCVDRIVLNAYFRMGHDPGGFRLWWRQLTGSDATLDNAHVMRLSKRVLERSPQSCAVWDCATPWPDRHWPTPTSYVTGASGLILRLSLSNERASFISKMIS